MSTVPIAAADRSDIVCDDGVTIVRGAPAFETICATCDGIALAYGGGSLWCLTCLTPLIAKGKDFAASIEVHRA